MNEDTIARMEGLSIHPKTKQIADLFDIVIKEVGNADTSAEIVACVLIALERGGVPVWGN